MSGEALLATPARPLYEPSHRPPKKDRPKSLSFCSDNTVTDDQQAAPVHSGPPFFGFRAYSRCDRSGLMLDPRRQVTRFGELLPISEMGQEETHAPQQIAKLFDHLVGAGEQLLVAHREPSVFAVRRWVYFSLR